MTEKPVVSVKGYYYDLEKSPYVWESPYGDSFKLPSKKRLQMMEKRVPIALHRLEKLLVAHNLKDIMPEELKVLVAKYVIRAVHIDIVKE